MRNLADADTSSMTRAFAGKFAPTPEMFALANRSSELMAELFGLIRDVLRPDLEMHDVSLVFELVAAIKFADPGRTTELRHRYLALILDGMRATDRGELPGPPPAWTELSERGAPASQAKGHAGRGPGACPRAWPGPGRRGSRALLDQLLAQRLRRRQLPRPRILAGDQPGHGVHGEVGGRHAVEVVPTQRERHRNARPHPRAVRGGDRRAVRPGRVEEDLALPVVLDERGGGQAGSSRSARAAMARVTAAASSLLARRARRRAGPWIRWS